MAKSLTDSVRAFCLERLFNFSNLWRLTINDRRKDSHPLKVGIAHCLVQYKASKTGKSQTENQNSSYLLCHLCFLFSQYLLGIKISSAKEL